MNLDHSDGDGVATAFSWALGRKVRYQAIPPDKFEANLRATVGEAVAADIVAVYRWMPRTRTRRCSSPTLGRSAGGSRSSPWI
jgi:hypothetical protein